MKVSPVATLLSINVFLCISVNAGPRNNGTRTSKRGPSGKRGPSAKRTGGGSVGGHSGGSLDEGVHVHIDGGGGNFQKSNSNKSCGTSELVGKLQETFCSLICQGDNRQDFIPYYEIVAESEYQEEPSNPADNREQISISSCSHKSLACQYRPLCKSLVGTDKPAVCELPCESEEPRSLPENCRDIFRSGVSESGIYEIQPSASFKPFTVLCDMEIDGGGWTHIQKRVDGSQNFDLGWREYKFGFGSLNGEFWLGLENIHALTGSEHNELLVEITGQNGKNVYANYKSFAIGNESDGYRLIELTHFAGNAGDSLTYHLGNKFSTRDYDQDVDAKHNWAALCKGGWWYGEGFHSSLNGKLLNDLFVPGVPDGGLNWVSFKDNRNFNPRARMMVRPIDDFWYAQRMLNDSKDLVGPAAPAPPAPPADIADIAAPAAEQ